MKLIAVMPVKNEEWIIERTLETLSHWCDAIIVADQGSTDSTLEICRRYPKVVVVQNPSDEFNEQQRRQILLDAARQFDGKNLIFALDADEIVSATVLEGNVLDDLINQMQPGTSAVLQWMMLWRHPFRYRDDQSTWSNSWKHFVYWDDRSNMGFGGGQIHLARVPEATLEHAIRFEGIQGIALPVCDLEQNAGQATILPSAGAKLGS